jgi:hypothetical protein
MRVRGTISRKARSMILTPRSIVGDAGVIAKTMKLIGFYVGRVCGRKN